MKYLYDAYTDVGGRTNNEDSLLTKGSAQGALFVVADGLGGHDSGEMASGIAVHELEKLFETDDFNIENAIRAANDKILLVQSETGLKMKTTVAAACVGKKFTCFANVGDSRVYAFKGSDIVFQSVDHSVSQMAVSVGEIEPSQIRYHEDRNILTRALGSTDDVKIDITMMLNTEFDALLLCSDGFWEYVLEEEMCELKTKSKTPSEWLDGMRKVLTTRIPDNNDNNTAVAVFLEENEI